MAADSAVNGFSLCKVTANLLISGVWSSLRSPEQAVEDSPVASSERCNTQSRSITYFRLELSDNRGSSPKDHSLPRPSAGKGYINPSLLFLDIRPKLW